MTTPAPTAQAEAGSWPKTMRAWIYDKTTSSVGLDKSLRLDPSAAPPPESSLTPDAVLVRVSHMSLNPADYKVAEMPALLARAITGGPPACPGMDFSGRVVRAGATAKEKYEAGSVVFGRVEPSKFGTLAEYVLVKNGEGLARAPEGGAGGSGEGLMAKLACVGTTGLTALQSIEPYLKGAGKEDKEGAAKVLINGGSGGTGTFGIQIARALGCRVVATCSAANAELCRGLGAEEVVDYRAQGGVVGALVAGGQEEGAKKDMFDLVVDNVGYTPRGEKDLHAAADGFLKQGGSFIQVGGGASKDMVAATAKRALLPGFLGGGKRSWKMIVTSQSHEGLARIGGWIGSGEVKPVIDEVFPFEKANEAYAKLKTGRAKGNIVVKVSE